MCKSDGAALPMVSVVMIAYNKEACIADAIAGVVRQRTDFAVELIIMDDCSTDGTPDIIREWCERYPDVIRAVRNPHNLGLQGNYMAGFKLCRGKYMAICDADDYWCSRRKLARQVRYMERHPDCHVTFHRMLNYYEDSGEKSLSNGLMKADTTLADLSRSNYITNSSVMYRRERVDLNALPEWLAEMTSPDYAMHMLYASEGHIHFFNRPMGVYRKAAGSAWSLTGLFAKRSMAIAVRLNLMEHYAGRADVVAGLRDSIAAMLRAMAAEAADEAERGYIAATATRIGVTVEFVGIDYALRQRQQPQSRRPLASRVRAALFRLLPLPRP